jgi:hypothetical protein
MLYEYEYVLPDDIRLGTSRQAHASVFRTRDWNPRTSTFPSTRSHTSSCDRCKWWRVNFKNVIRSYTTLSGSALACQLPCIQQLLVISPPRIAMVGFVCQRRIFNNLVQYRAVANRNNNSLSVPLGHLSLSLSSDKGVFHGSLSLSLAL